MKLPKSLTACSVFAAVVGLAMPASAITFTNTFTDRTTFQNSLTSFSVEDFNDVTTSTDYSSTPFDAGDFTLSTSGKTDSASFPDTNFTQVTPSSGVPFNSFKVNGTPQAVGGVDDPDGRNIFTFDSPTTAFGADFAEVRDNGKITNLVSGDASVQFPIIDGGPNPSNSFFGVTSDTPFTEIAIEFGQGSVIEGYGVDDVTFETTSQPVPFEAEGTMGLVVLGGYFCYRFYRKKRSAKA